MKKVVLSSIVLAAAIQSFAAGTLSISTASPAPFVFSQFIADGTVPASTTGAGFFNKGAFTSSTTDALGQAWFFVKGDQDSGAFPLRWQDSYTPSGSSANVVYSAGTNGNSVIGFKVNLTYSLVSYNANAAIVKVDFTVKNVVTGTRTVDLYALGEMNALDGTGNGSGATTCAYNPVTQSFQFSTTGGVFQSYFAAGTTPNSYTGGNAISLRNTGFGNAYTGNLNNSVAPDTDMSGVLHYRMTLAPNETSTVKTIYYGWNTLPQTGRTVSGNITRNGGRSLSSISVQFRDAGTQTAVGSPISVPVDVNGNYTVNAPGAGNYDITVMPAPYLRRTINANTTANNVTGANLNLIPGNVVMDQVVDIADYAKIALYFDATSGDANWNTPDGDGIRPSDADLNADGIIDIADYALLAANFDAVGDN